MITDDVIHYTTLLTSTQQNFLCGRTARLTDSDSKLYQGTRDKNQVTCLICLRVGFNPITTEHEFLTHQAKRAAYILQEELEPPVWYANERKQLVDLITRAMDDEVVKFREDMAETIRTMAHEEIYRVMSQAFK